MTTVNLSADNAVRYVTEVVLNFRGVNIKDAKALGQTGWNVLTVTHGIASVGMIIAVAAAIIGAFPAAIAWGAISYFARTVAEEGYTECSSWVTRPSQPEKIKFFNHILFYALHWESAAASTGSSSFEH